MSNTLSFYHCSNFFKILRRGKQFYKFSRTALYQNKSLNIWKCSTRWRKCSTSVKKFLFYLKKSLRSIVYRWKKALIILFRSSSNFSTYTFLAKYSDISTLLYHRSERSFNTNWNDHWSGNIIHRIPLVKSNVFTSNLSRWY